MNTPQHLRAVLEVLQLAERLKCELRHSYTSDGRQESVAEHTWRMSLMAVLLEPYLTQKIDAARLLKMIIIHDLVEAEAGDVSVLDVLRNPGLKAIKQAREKAAIENLRRQLDGPLGQDIYDLWHEFEDKTTYEARVANALDKLEVQLQHNDAPLSTWEEIEYEMSFMLGKHTDFDPVLSQLKELIEAQAETKMRQGGVDVQAARLRAWRI
jgi:putative hydrolase of HD superfamily